MIGTELPHVAGRSTVGSLFRDRAALHPGRPAIEAAGRALTYGQLNERVNRAAAVLRGFGGPPDSNDSHVCHGRHPDVSRIR